MRLLNPFVFKSLLTSLKKYISLLFYIFKRIKLTLSQMNFLLLSPLFRFVITPTCISKIKYPYLGKLHSTPISLRCRLKRDNSYDFLSNLCCQQLDKIYNKIIQSTCLKLYIKNYIFEKYLKNNKSKIKWIPVL